MPHRGPRTRAIWWQEEALYSPSSNGATQEPTVFTDFWALGWSSFRRHVIIMLNYTPMARAVHGSCQEDPVSGDLWVMDWSCLRTPCICPPVISGINLLKKPLYVHTSALGWWSVRRLVYAHLRYTGWSCLSVVCIWITMSPGMELNEEAIYIYFIYVNLIVLGENCLRMACICFPVSLPVCIFTCFCILWWSCPRRPCLWPPYGLRTELLLVV